MPDATVRRALTYGMESTRRRQETPAPRGAPDNASLDRDAAALAGARAASVASGQQAAAPRRSRCCCWPPRCGWRAATTRSAPPSVEWCSASAATSPSSSPGNRLALALADRDADQARCRRASSALDSKAMMLTADQSLIDHQLVGAVPHRRSAALPVSAARSGDDAASGERDGDPRARGAQRAHGVARGRGARSIAAARRASACSSCSIAMAPASTSPA